MERTTCRLCGGSNLFEYLNLGMHTLANEYLDSPSTEQTRYTLAVNYCQDCGHSQLSEVVDPHEMFDNYLYVSGTPKLFNDHCEELAYWAVGGAFREDVGIVRNGDLVVDIASNDGTMLSKFKTLPKHIRDKHSFYDVNLVGIDPAKNLKHLAEEKGIDQFDEYLSQDVAQRVVDKYGKKASLIIAQNVFAHVDNLDEFVKSVSIMLDDVGMFIIEAPYLGSLLEQNEFDTVYHEHLSYLLVRPLKQFFEKYDMDLFGVKFFPELHGGTMRYHIAKKDSGVAPQWNEQWFKKSGIIPSSQIIEDEEQKGFYDFDTYRIFATRVDMTMWTFWAFIRRAKLIGKKIALFGAGAKGCVFINSTLDKHVDPEDPENINANAFCAIYDENSLKQGKYITGSKIEIKSPEQIINDQPDYIVVLTWNFKDEIIKRCKEKYGFTGRFVIAVPTLQFI